MKQKFPYFFYLLCDWPVLSVSPLAKDDSLGDDGDSELPDDASVAPDSVESPEVAPLSVPSDVRFDSVTAVTPDTSVAPVAPKASVVAPDAEESVVAAAEASVALDSAEASVVPETSVTSDAAEAPGFSEVAEASVALTSEVSDDAPVTPGDSELSPVPASPLLSVAPADGSVVTSDDGLAVVWSVDSWLEPDASEVADSGDVAPEKIAIIITSL